MTKQKKAYKKKSKAKKTFKSEAVVDLTPVDINVLPWSNDQNIVLHKKQAKKQRKKQVKKTNTYAKKTRKSKATPTAWGVTHSQLRPVSAVNGIRDVYDRIRSDAIEDTPEGKRLRRNLLIWFCVLTSMLGFYMGYTF